MCVHACALESAGKAALGCSAVLLELNVSETWFEIIGVCTLNSAMSDRDGLKLAED